MNRYKSLFKESGRIDEDEAWNIVDSIQRQLPKFEDYYPVSLFQDRDLYTVMFEKNRGGYVSVQGTLDWAASYAPAMFNPTIVNSPGRSKTIYTYE